MASELKLGIKVRFRLFLRVKRPLQISLSSRMPICIPVHMTDMIVGSHPDQLFEIHMHFMQIKQYILSGQEK